MPTDWALNDKFSLETKSDATSMKRNLSCLYCVQYAYHSLSIQQVHANWPVYSQSMYICLSIHIGRQHMESWPAGAGAGVDIENDHKILFPLLHSYSI